MIREKWRLKFLYPLDHPLKGDWEGHRECHIGGDFLLAYKIDDTNKIGQIVFVRAGTHADLFGE